MSEVQATKVVECVYISHVPPPYLRITPIYIYKVLRLKVIWRDLIVIKVFHINCSLKNQLFGFCKISETLSREEGVQHKGGGAHESGSKTDLKVWVGEPD